MNLTREKRKKLEKFYTKKETALVCWDITKKVMQKKKITNVHFLEPSAGSGVFLSFFDPHGYDAYDIEPESELVSQKDFLNMPLNNIVTDKSKDLVVVGNPPYKLAVKFINKCAKLNPKVIAMILPNVFKKPSVFNKINCYYHFTIYKTLPKNSFKLGEEAYDVPSGFYVLEKKDNARAKVNMRVPMTGFKYIPFSSLTFDGKKIIGADISVIRIGGRSGMAFAANDESDDAKVSKKKYNYFIKLGDSSGVDGVIARINEAVWEVANTTGPRSIGKYELTPVLNKILET
jgi:hypothetical protein